jgi:hypothetical protein
MAHLPEHACEDRAVVVLDGLADPAEPERPKRPAMASALADLATNLRDPELAHD